MRTSTSTARDGFDHWLNNINQICGAFDAQPMGSAFSGQIEAYHRGALKLSIVDACQARLFRGQRELAASEGGNYFAVFQLEGNAAMAQGDHRALLDCGDITLIDADQPCDFTYSENSRQVSLILPHTLVEQALRFNTVRCGERIPGNSPVATLASRLVLETTRQPALSHAESEATLEAIVSLLRPAIGRAEPACDQHERMFRKTLAFIDAHIKSDELCPELLAREVGVSVRGLYRMFSKKGLVVAQYIKNRRLDFCAESLRQRGVEQKLSALGYSWGFSDSSYFSTAFRARFGVSPGEYRKQFA
ncbi:transcriptional regulator FeaR [Pseudomonas sp. R5(2019)]|uniref:transcriptional regulator FeaR n=1 Tax=Pseudomonas sp. R5(2019) TaxID=2697566 RepID=UPI00141255BD|nr:transcriptional regulator FeaR [Pseudomonas sp. R5(2019)]NBA97390.1 transcriptional regulator FeaR [Pseudomonas sp. R5(2019)]